MGLEKNLYSCDGINLGGIEDVLWKHDTNVKQYGNGKGMSLTNEALIYDIDKKKQLKRSDLNGKTFDQNFIANGNFAVLHPDGTARKISVVKDAGGNAYYSLSEEPVNPVRKPNFLKLFVNLFKSVKDTDVQQWNEWKDYLKVAEVRKKYMKKNHLQPGKGHTANVIDAKEFDENKQLRDNEKKELQEQEYIDRNIKHIKNTDEVNKWIEDCKSGIHGKVMNNLAQALQNYKKGDKVSSFIHGKTDNASDFYVASEFIAYTVLFRMAMHNSDLRKNINSLGLDIVLQDTMDKIMDFEKTDESKMEGYYQDCLINGGVNTTNEFAEFKNKIKNNSNVNNPELLNLNTKTNVKSNDDSFDNSEDLINISF